MLVSPATNSTAYFILDKFSGVNKWYPIFKHVHNQYVMSTSFNCPITSYSLFLHYPIYNAYEPMVSHTIKIDKEFTVWVNTEKEGINLFYIKSATNKGTPFYLPLNVTILPPDPILRFNVPPYFENPPAKKYVFKTNRESP